ncbi:transcriptional regulator [Rhizobium laguerreae]|nr:transcriptional regulator [Rhizobium laguerreae]
MPTLTGMHLRAARALLRWRVQELARRSRVPIETLKRAELLDGPVNMTAPEQEAIIKALQMGGVSLIEDPALGFGAAFNRQQARSSDLIG